MPLADVWQTSPTMPRLPLAESMRSAARGSGRKPAAQVRDIARLALAPGKLQPDEYFYYRLFDDRYDDRLQRTFVGRRLEEHLHRLTCEPEWRIVAHDKLLCYGLLQSLGYPVPRNRAVYRRGADFPGTIALADRAALASALRGGLAGPSFGKPVRGIRSVGVLSIDGYDEASDSLRLAHGHAIAVEDIVEALEAFGGDGYLFQEPIRQHPDVVEVCAEAVATVRAIVLLGPEGPELHLALWKIPVGANVADNFWREGNALAAVDPNTGRLTRAIQGVGSKLCEIAAHPISGKALIDFALPDWPAVRRLVLSAASALPGVRMQAWDVALGTDGPLLVEVNIGGDYNLPQLATGQGMLDARFLEFLRYCAAERGLERTLKRLKLAPRA